MAALACAGCLAGFARVSAAQSREAGEPSPVTVRTVAPSPPAGAVAVSPVPSPRLAAPSVLTGVGARSLRYDLRVDVPVMLAGGAAWLLTELFRGSIVPVTCRWCDTDSAGVSALNGLDLAARNAFRWTNTHAADTLSNVVAYGALPVTQFGLLALAAVEEHQAANIPVDAMVVVEASILAADLNQVFKLIAARQRPFVHFAPAGEPGMREASSDNNLSFYSGHTTLVFSLATASGSVATMRGYRAAPWIWLTGIGLATFTGYLRIAADRHYLTDVLGGALLGSGMGLLVPWLFHSPAARVHHSAVTLSALPVVTADGLSLTLAGVF